MQLFRALCVTNHALKTVRKNVSDTLASVKAVILISGLTTVHEPALIVSRASATRLPVSVAKAVILDTLTRSVAHHVCLLAAKHVQDKQDCASHVKMSSTATPARNPAVLNALQQKMVFIFVTRLVERAKQAAVCLDLGT